ncbi:MAG: PSD1 and planctomycete cytochrome C domain-containing protein [Gemmataceae bacterium]
MTTALGPVVLALVLVGQPTAGPIEFNRDIRPLFSEFCFTCHGPDTAKRKGDLRLDVEEGGRSVLVAGKPDQSELFTRLHLKDPKKRMPPASTGKTLSAKQIDLLRRWIEQGAPYQKHWALLTAKRPPLPPVRNDRWGRNPVDRFLLARLEAEGLTPSPEAERRSLIRRLSFDLLGLPPTPAEVDAFVNDRDDRAYDRLVDRMLASKHFGERMGLFWLDLVRYGDTGGYHSDNHRDIYLYRDYVIDAFNANKRFDQFTIEQLAGDLLPDATRETRIASGYNRMLMTTEEGGAQAKEYLAKYASDRVRNASSVWLGLTMSCAECHNHKYDPVSTKEFYRFASFWADVQEVPVGRQPQTKIPTAAQEVELKRLDAELAEARKALNAAARAVEAGQKRWEETATAELAAAKKSSLPKPVQEALKTPADKRTKAHKDALSAHYRTIAPELADARRRVAEAEGRHKALEASFPQTLVTTAGAPRTMRMLPRGNWLDDSGEIVSPDTPAALPPLGVTGRRATRLDLARWLVSADQPLTPRVFVNRVWRLFYGQGLVTTLEDFGAQGNWPSHPELMEWLAAEFRDSGWDVKHLVKLLVTSSAYRQVSTGSEALRQADPYNRLLARQGRFRLDAELVRDNALAVSGLLVRKVGGPSVKPYQPAGYWAYLNFPTRDYVADRGDDQYRRGVYTYIQRTFPHPSLLAFDAPSREECVADRPRSNTPQQALVLLNDPTYVEASRVLAEKALKAAATDEERLRFAYRQTLGRAPRPQESQLLLTLLARHRDQYKTDPSAAAALLAVGQAPAGKDADRATLAAWTSVTRTLLNLHETITRE